MKRTLVICLTLLGSLVGGSAFGADEIHWTITGPTSVSFDWRGAEQVLRYGVTPSYLDSVVAGAPSPLPFSSPGPFREARLTNLVPNFLYHYSIGGGPDHTFRTAPRPGGSGFMVDVEGDIGSTADFARAGIVQNMIAGDAPTFALLVGDLTYGGSNGQASVDQHFNDVMAWSLDAAYMPAWGNAEWDRSTDDLRNYKGRFDLPNPQTSPNAPQPGGIGKDWYWFDYGNTRFIAYPDLWTGAYADWYPKARALMDSAQADPNITFIVTMGHRPAYSSGHHPGSTSLKGYMDSLGTSHSKYVLNLNGHSHNYERSYPQHGVVHITAAGGGAALEEDPSGSCLWLGGCPAPSWSAFRAYHHGYVRLTFSNAAILEQEICGPPGDNGSSKNDVTCTQGSVLDEVVIRPGGVTTGVESGSSDDAAMSASLSPNPVYQRATLTFTLPAPGRVHIAVFDVHGRKVRSVLDPQSLSAGRHTVDFAWREPGGASPPSGIYFCRVATANRSVVARFAAISP